MAQLIAYVCGIIRCIFRNTNQTKKPGPFPSFLTRYKVWTVFTFSNMTNNGLDNRRTRRVIIL